MKYIIFFTFICFSQDKVDLYKKISESILNYERFSLDRYGSYLGKKRYQQIKNMGDAFLPLLIDPGVSEHVDELVDFQKSTPELDPWKLRKSFSEKMGMKQVFRGIVLTDSEYEEIMRNGMESKGKDPFTDNVYHRAFFRYPLGGIDGENDFLMSVTDFYDVAHLVANQMFERQTKKGKIYIFEYDVPKIELIYNRYYYDINETFISMKNGETNEFPMGNQVESFVHLQLNSRLIKDVHSEPYAKSYRYKMRCRGPLSEFHTLFVFSTDHEKSDDLITELKRLPQEDQERLAEYFLQKSNWYLSYEDISFKLASYFAPFYKKMHDKPLLFLFGDTGAKFNLSFLTYQGYPLGVEDIYEYYKFQSYLKKVSPQDYAEFKVKWFVENINHLNISFSESDKEWLSHLVQTSEIAEFKGLVF